MLLSLVFYVLMVTRSHVGTWSDNMSIFITYFSKCRQYWPSALNKACLLLRMHCNLLLVIVPIFYAMWIAYLKNTLRTYCTTNSKRFWRRCIILRTNCLLDFVHHLDKILKYNIKITTFRKLVRLPSSGDGRGDTYTDGSFRPSPVIEISSV
jgi:hypothetical protein